MQLTFFRTCSRCKESKFITNFYRNRIKKGGYSNYCKSCADESSKKWIAENLDRVHERENRERHEHRERYRESERRYYQKNPKKNTEKNWNRRAAKITAGDNAITAAEFIALCEKYGNICLCCKRSDVALTLDHIVPISKGGKHTIENSQPLCKSCNSRKHDRTIDYR